MLDKRRNLLIRKAFESAKIVAPGTELTAEEINDAVYTLNCMLQAWSNDGFRLFTMKTGYMPLLTKKNEYSLASQAFSSFSCANITRFENIGATKVSVTSISGAGIGQKLVFLSNVFSKQNIIDDIDYEASVLTLKEPVNMSLYVNDDVFFGETAYAKTEVKQYLSSFSSLVFSEHTLMPSIGDTVFLNYNNSWVKDVIINVDSVTNTIYLGQEYSRGKITKQYIVFGDNIERAKCSQTVLLSPRKLSLSVDAPYAVSASVKSGNVLDEAIDVEKIEGNSVYLTKGVSESTLSLLGVEYIDGKKRYTPSKNISWYDIPTDITTQILDWGSVTEVPASEFDDWGFVTDAVTGQIDMSSLTGSAEIQSYAKVGNDTYVAVNSGEYGALLYKGYNQEWISIKEGTDIKIIVVNSLPYSYNTDDGINQYSGGNSTNVFSLFKIEHVLEFSGKYYLVSEELGDGYKRVVTTEDFVAFSPAYNIPGYVDASNAVVFDGRVYCGYKKTYVSLDMKSFSDISVYAENRAVVSNMLINFNTEALCSYTTDGVTFYPMPTSIGNLSACISVTGCSFLSIYGKRSADGVIGSQILSKSEPNAEWTEQFVVDGRVKNIYKSGNTLFFVSDIEVKSIVLATEIKSNGAEVCLFGEQIGRPQEIMNVVKYNLYSSAQSSMEELSLKDYSQLPHAGADGEPVSYCFFRDAKDGTMMVWGTPKKFGDYLKFTYVEPIALLDNARSIPDIPDEYIGAVIDGLAAELAHEYAAPVDRVQLLQSKADASKEMAILHDNENTSYVISPYQRG